MKQKIITTALDFRSVFALEVRFKVSRPRPYPATATAGGNDGVDYLQVADGVFQRDRHRRTVENRFGETICHDAVLVTHLHLQLFYLAATHKADNARAIIRRIESRLGQFYMTFSTRYMSPLERSNLCRASARCVADTEVETS